MFSASFMAGAPWFRQMTWPVSSIDNSDGLFQARPQHPSNRIRVLCRAPFSWKISEPNNNAEKLRMHTSIHRVRKQKAGAIGTDPNDSRSWLSSEVESNPRIQLASREIL
jgi:hypothetical protein